MRLWRFCRSGSEVLRPGSIRGLNDPHGPRIVLTLIALRQAEVKGYVA